LPAKKNKLNTDFFGREKKTSVVQRFITEETPAPQIPEPAPAPVPEIAPPPKYYLKNAMEDAVIDEARAALKHMTDMCRCEKCFYDVCALALNTFPASYATSEQGELFRKAVNLLNAETRNKIVAAVFDAITIVKENPIHGR